MNTYRKKNYRNKRNYSGRPRRTVDNYHQPMPPDRELIPVSRHTLTKPDVEAVVEALLSGTLVNGNELDRFESLLAKLTHSDHAIALSSGTAALHSALACLKLEPEDEVISCTLNHFGAANMIRLVGAKPVLVDCHAETLTIDVEATTAAITENTKAILANNFAGHPSDLALLREICEEHNLMLIEDASHGLGGKYRGHYVGNQADITCFSFQPSMAITTCEGGAVTTNNKTIAEWIRQFANHGLTPTNPKDKDAKAHGPKLQFSGMNYRLSDVLAALGRSQLTRLDRHIERRRSIAQVYQQKLNGSQMVTLPYVASWADHAYHLYPIKLAEELAPFREKILSELRHQSINAGVFFTPVHHMPAYADHADSERFPNAEDFYARSLCLPLFPDLSYKDIERITDQLLKLLTKYGPKPAPVEDGPQESATTEEGKADTSAETASQEDTSKASEARGEEQSGEKEAAAEKPKSRSRRPRSRKTAPAAASVAEAPVKSEEAPKKSAETADVEATAEAPVGGETAAEDAKAEKPKRLRKVPKAEEEAPKKPAKRTTRRKTTRSKTQASAKEDAPAAVEEATSPAPDAEEKAPEKPKRTRRRTTKTAKAVTEEEAKPKPKRTRTRKPKVEDGAKEEPKKKTTRAKSSTTTRKRAATKKATPEKEES